MTRDYAPIAVGVCVIIVVIAMVGCALWSLLP